MLEPTVRVITHAFASTSCNRIQARSVLLAGFPGRSIRRASSKRGGSSSRYLQRQRTDQYVKQRLSGLDLKKAGDIGDDAPSSVGGYAARSAFKLLQLDDQYRFLKPGRVIVDLGAAPGGWTQAIIERTSKTSGKAKKVEGGEGPRVFALDILPMEPIEGARILQGNFLDPEVQAKLRAAVKESHMGQSSPSDEGFIDVVVSDMMANTTGNSIADTEASLELCRSAFDFASRTLKKTTAAAAAARKGSIPKASTSSILILKYFMSHEADIFRRSVLEKSFHFVKAEKMDASRKESREQFWVCIGFKGRTDSS